MIKQPTDYYCSIHGSEGNSKCAECWAKLGQLLKDTDCHVVATHEDKKKMGVRY